METEKPSQCCEVSCKVPREPFVETEIRNAYKPKDRKGQIVPGSASQRLNLVLRICVHFRGKSDL